MKFLRCVFLSLIAVLFSTASAPQGQSVESLRPTADANYFGSLCNYGTETISSSMSAVYSGKSGSGPTGSSASISDTSSYGLGSSGRIFTNWATTSNSYSSLTVNLSAASAFTGDPGNSVQTLAYYSTNSGSTWTILMNVQAGSSQTTYSATITGSSLSSLQVFVCSFTNRLSGSATSTQTDYDLWTAGTYSTLISQGITFTAPTTPVAYGVSPITLVATGGASGNPVVFSVLSGPGTVSGNVLTVTGVGTITVAADQAGNSSYSAAAEVTQNVVVNQASQTIDFTAPASPQSYGASPIGLSAMASSGLTPTFSILSGPGSISGNTLTMTGEGTIVIAANQAGNANYAAAPQVEQSVVVTLPSQTVSFTAPLTEPYGAAPITLTATATSGLAVTFSVLSGPATLSGNTLTFTGSGTVVVAANQAGNSSYAAAPQITQYITVEAATGAQPQTQLAPISAVNAKYVQGVGPGFWPTAGSGLSVTLTAGTANCAGTIENYSATALALTALTTNYVYLNTAAACAPAVKTSPFTSSDISIATIVAGASSITSIQDDRTMFQGAPSSGIYTSLSVKNLASIGARYDVTQFGAVGDGATDDTAAIQAAFDICYNGGIAPFGGVVEFPGPHTYIISSTINAHDGCQLEGVVSSSTTAGRPVSVYWNGTSQGMVTTITAFSVSSGTATFTAANTLIAGEFVDIEGLTTASGVQLNRTIAQVSATGLSSSQFEIPVNMGSTSLTSDSGTATNINVMLALDSNARYEQSISNLFFATKSGASEPQVDVYFGGRVDTGTHVINTEAAEASEYGFYFAYGGINVDFDKGWRCDGVGLGCIYWRVAGADSLELPTGRLTTAAPAGPL